MRTIGVIAVVALALTLQTTLAGLVVGSAPPVDLALVAVVSIALVTGPVGGMLAGSVAGLAQDALSSGVVGVGGLAKSIVGCAVGVIGRQFILTALVPRFVVFVGATGVHAAIFMGLYAVLGLSGFPAPWGAVASQAMANAAVGVVAFMIVEALPGVVERRRAGRRQGS